MQRPLIGITARHDTTSEKLTAVMLLQAYVTAIIDAGGAPILIPPELPEDGWRVLLDRLDGVLFSGGADIGLEHFDGEPHPTVEVNPARDELELPLLRAAVDADKPTLGICRGFQVMNVALGGTLDQHIPDVPGRGPHGGGVRHEVEIVPWTLLSTLVAARRGNVNSFHHQSVGRLAPGLRVAARTADGGIEAVEGLGRFCLGVQWHPERENNDPSFGPELFARLVDAARKAGMPAAPRTSNP